MEKILRISLGDRSFSFEDARGPFYELAGRGLTSFIVSSEVPPAANPLGPKNKLVFSPGYLGGTNLSSSGRLSIGAKSPLTGTIKESNVGGTAGSFIARSGLRAIVLEGMSSDWVYLLIKEGGVEFVPAGDLVGVGNYRLAEVMFERYGGDISVISIGPAGEMRLPSSSVAVTDMDGHPSRHAGRGGLGAVMGSKRVKAIVVTGKGSYKGVEGEDRFRELAISFAKSLSSHEVTGNLLRNLGTNVLMQVINDAGALPVKNFRFGSFERVSRVNADAMLKNINERGGKPTHPCMPGCVIGCSNVYNDKNGNYVTSGLEYETVWANGPNIMVDDLDIIAEVDRLCDDIGLDTIEVGDTFAVLMEAGIVDWGDGNRVLELLREVYNGSPMGRIVASGALGCARIFGISRVAHVKGQGFPAYDPRACKGIGVTYATSPMGADHTAGYVVAPSILKVGGDLDPLSREGQVENSRDVQVFTAFFDCTGLCVFSMLPVVDKPDDNMPILFELLALRGVRLDEKKALELGMKVISMERRFNRRAGFSSSSDTIPEFFREEPLPPHGTVFDIDDEAIGRAFGEK